MKDKDAHLMMEALREAEWPPEGRDWLNDPTPSIPDGRLLPDADILARVDRVMDNYARSGSSTTFVSAIIDDLDRLIDGGGDADILRHYEGWGMQDLVQLVTILKNKLHNIENDL